MTTRIDPSKWAIARIDSEERFDYNTTATGHTALPGDIVFFAGDAPCRCHCESRRVNGRLQATGACECEREVGVRIDKHGDPKSLRQPCSPTMPQQGNNIMRDRTDSNDERLDAISAKVVDAEMKRDRAFVDAWRTENLPAAFKNEPAQDGARIDARAVDAEPDAIVRAQLRRDQAAAEAWKNPPQDPKGAA